jgi:hypothetical protein
VKQTVLFNTVKDTTTGVTTYTPADPSNNSVKNILSPKLEGYKPNQADTYGNVFTQTTVKPENTNVTVAYSQLAQKITVNYIDDTDGTTVNTHTVSGKYWDTFDVSTNEYDHDKYTLVGEPDDPGFPQNDGTQDKVKTITVHLTHVHTTGTLDKTSTVHYQYADGTKALDDQAQTVTWNTDTDEVTGVTTYTPTGNFETVTSPTIDGYTPNATVVGENTSFETTTDEPTAGDYTVTYTANATDPVPPAPVEPVPDPLPSPNPDGPVNPAPTPTPTPIPEKPTPVIPPSGGLINPPKDNGTIKTPPKKEEGKKHESGKDLPIIPNSGDTNKADAHKEVPNIPKTAPDSKLVAEKEAGEKAAPGVQGSQAELPHTGENETQSKVETATGFAAVLAAILGFFGLGAKRKKDQDEQ